MTTIHTEQNRLLLVLVLGALTCLGPMAIDLYLPAMPEIARSFGEPLGRIQLTLSAYTIGFALGQMIFGPLSDRFGRLRIMLPGIVAFIITNLMAAMASNASELIFIRVLQALAGASVMVCIPAMVRDLFHRDECAKVLSSILLVMTAAPLLAPILGGQILRFASWQALFIFLAGFGVLTLILGSFKLKESLPVERRIAMSPKALVAAYKEVLTHRRAMSKILAHGFFFGGMFAFVSASPFVYIELHGVPVDQYGYLFGLNIIGMGLCNIINMRLMGRFPLKNLLSFGVYAACASSTVLLINAWTGFGGLVGLVIPVIVYVSCMGFTGPNSNALSLQHFPNTAGTANAVAGVLRFGIGGVTTALAGLLHDGTAIPMGVVVAACGWLSVFSLVVIGGKSQGQEESEELEPTQRAA